jgi:hypothetical protein
VLALCPDCGATTSFDVNGFSNTSLGVLNINVPHTYEGANYGRVLWQFFRCNVCSRGAVAKIHESGNTQTAVLEDFLPQAIEKASLPPAVAEDIVSEFRESEIDAAHGAYRSASAMMRSVLEKTLKKNGYKQVEIEDNQGNSKKSNRLID